MSNAIIAYGGTIERSTDGSTFTAIPEAKGIAVPSKTTEYVDVTNLDSPNRSREFIRGLQDPGEVTIPCNYTVAGYQQQAADEAEAEPIYYRATFAPQPGQSTGDVFEFRGFPTPQIEANDLGQPVMMNITIRVTGDSEFTAGS